MKTKFFFLVAIWLAAHSTCNELPPTILERATMQGYSGGAVGSNPGNYYRIYLKMPNSKDVRFDSLWTDNRRIEATRLAEESSDSEQVVYANEIMSMPGPPQRAVPDTTHYNYPIPAANAQGVLGYFYKGKRKYLVIPSWNVLPRLRYP